jgi:hypothetical protein
VQGNGLGPKKGEERIYAGKQLYTNAREKKNVHTGQRRSQ